jgi:hypothetical protein
MIGAGRAPRKGRRAQGFPSAANVAIRLRFITFPELRQPPRVGPVRAAHKSASAPSSGTGRQTGFMKREPIDSSKDGTVFYALIAGRGQFDLKGQVVAVLWSVLDRPSAQGPIGIKVSAKQLAEAPRILCSSTYRLMAPAARSRIYGCYGRPYPYYGTPGWYGPYRRPYAPMAGGNYAYQSQAANVR